MRLQKFLARAGVASRRKSETFIQAGRVQVNGEVVRELGTKVNPATDEVQVDGALVVLAIKPVVIMLHKPAGYLSAMKDDRGRPCVSELVPVQEYPGLFPVGRLDFDTTGLLLFTTDGALGNKLLHPSSQIDKVYEACVEGVPHKDDLARLEVGVMLEDGMSAPAACRVKDVDRKRNIAHLQLTIHEGRKRQVKRMCAAIGHPVKSLHRSQFACLTLGTLKSGKYRILEPKELEELVSCIQ